MSNLKYTIMVVGFISITTSSATAHKDKSAKKAYSVHINKTNERIVLDGILDEDVWKDAEPAKDFFQIFPFDTSFSKTQTEVKLTYDDQFIYLAVTCHSPQKRKKEEYLISSLKRDFHGPENDLFSFTFDPFMDQTNGFNFGLTPYGVKREALISNGHTMNYEWDNKWYSNTKIYDDYWIGEIAIPFKTLRFKGGADKWRISFFRIDTQENERSSWVPIPRGFGITYMSFAGEMIWDKPLENPGMNLSVIPYVTTGAQRNYEPSSGDHHYSFGADAKIGITPSLNLDVTVNPDFSQVEVDRQVTNLSRFELFFPERRQFFIENSDLFSDFGTRAARPFFSRRIGIAYDSANNQNILNRIQLGARLSGKINNNWRVGLLTAQTEADESIGLNNTNYTVGVVQRRIFKSSNISAIFVNKQTIDFQDPEKFISIDKGFNRVAGLDYNLISPDSRWIGKVFYHQAFTPEKKDGQYSHGAHLTYNTTSFKAEWDHQIVGEHFEAAVGFVPRKNFKSIAPAFTYRIYPSSKLINWHGPILKSEIFWDENNMATDRKTDYGYDFHFQNSARLLFSISDNFIYLFRPFDPTNTGGTTLEQATTYRYYDLKTEYTSDQRKVVFFHFNTHYGEYFNGSIAGFSGDFNLRYRPFGLASIAYSYNKIKLPSPYASADLLLIGPKFDITFSKSIFMSSFIQYNNQINNINVNTRIQWRFKPVSDFFLVYTDNYYADNLNAKNRALILKLSYWLNI